MTDLRTAAQQALEALLTPSGAQACSTCQNGPENEYCCRMEMWSAITNLRAALAQQAEPVEPVAWYQKRGQEVLTSHPACWGREDEPWTPLYTAPPQRKPLPKHDQHCVDVPGYGLTAVRLVRAVERAHGIKE